MGVNLVRALRERWVERRRRYDRMLGPKVELPGGLRRWTEESMQWLLGQFGVEPLRRPVVLPSMFVPDDYDGSEAAGRALCRKVCEWMAVPADDIRFSFQLDKVWAAARGAAVHALSEYGSSWAARQDPEAVKGRMLLAVSGLRSDVTKDEIDALMGAGFAPELTILREGEIRAELQRCWNLIAATDPDRKAELQRAAEATWTTTPGTRTSGGWFNLRKDTSGQPTKHNASAIMFSAELLSDPARLVAATAHELGHEVLEGRNLIDPRRPDAEALADLFAVFQGFGIFLINESVVPVKGRVGELTTFGYLGRRGYAEALASCWVRQRELCSERPVMPAWRSEIDGADRAEVIRRVKALSRRPAAPVS